MKNNCTSCCLATMFLEFWKRRQAEISYEWDLMNFEDEEVCKLRLSTPSFISFILLPSHISFFNFIFHFNSSFSPFLNHLPLPSSFPSPPLLSSSLLPPFFLSPFLHSYFLPISLPSTYSSDKLMFKLLLAYLVYSPYAHCVYLGKTKSRL